MSFEPVPQACHWLEGFPGRQFSASIAFLGALHVAKAETARSECASVSRRVRWKASCFLQVAGGRRIAALRKRTFHIRAEFARRKFNKRICSAAFTQLSRFIAHPAQNGQGINARAQSLAVACVLQGRRNYCRETSVVSIRWVHAIQIRKIP